MEIISVINQKGGVGKSTTSTAIGSGLVKRGKKVLFIDLDAQGNLSSTFPIESSSDLNAFGVMRKTCTISEAIQKTDHGDIIQSSPYLSNPDLIFADTPVGKELRLSEILSTSKLKYDYIIIDTPPSLGVLTLSALTASNSIIIPAQADTFSIQGIAQLFETLKAIKTVYNKKLTIRGFVLTRHNPRAIISKNATETLGRFAESSKTKLFKTYIRECTAIKEAHAMKQSIFDYAPKSNAAKDYNDLIDEIFGKDVEK